MPARKPAALIDFHRERSKREAREEIEAAITPKTAISKKPPSALKRQPGASGIWRRLVGLFLQIDGTIITAFDENILIIYCQAEAELQEMQLMRDEMEALWTRHAQLLNTFKPKTLGLKNYAGMLAGANMLLERFEKLDGRIDGKRKMLHEIAQAFFITPRSRSGVAPQERPPEGPESDMERLLNEDR